MAASEEKSFLNWTINRNRYMSHSPYPKCGYVAFIFQKIDNQCWIISYIFILDENFILYFRLQDALMFTYWLNVSNTQSWCLWTDLKEMLGVAGSLLGQRRHCTSNFDTVVSKPINLTCVALLKCFYWKTTDAPF